MDIKFKTNDSDFSLDFRNIIGFQVDVIKNILEEENIFFEFEKDLGLSKNELLSKINSSFYSDSLVALDTMKVKESCLAANILIDYNKYGSRLVSYFFNSMFVEKAFIDEEYSKIFCDNMILFFEKFGHVYKERKSIINVLYNSINSEEYRIKEDELLMAEFIDFLKSSKGKKIIVFNDFDLDTDIELCQIKKMNNWEKILLEVVSEIDSFDELSEWFEENFEDKVFIFDCIWEKNFNQSKKFIFSGKEFFDGGVNLLSFLKNYN